MTDKELTDFIEHGENGFVEFALTFGDGWAGQAIEIAKELRAALTQPEKTDMQIGLTYEEANPPEELARLEQAMIEAWKPIPKKEWVGLTDYEVDQIEIKASSKTSAIYLAEAKLKEKNT